MPAQTPPPETLVEAARRGRPDVSESPTGDHNRGRACRTARALVYSLGQVRRIGQEGV